MQENACSEPLIRSTVFVFDITFHYEFIDITNKPFGRQMNFTKADCKGIKTKGSPMLFPKDFLKLALEELSWIIWFLIYQHFYKKSGVVA